jgi:ABC-type lipoprotein export system ATPase subunit
MIEKISIFAGHGRGEHVDSVPRIDFFMGDVVSIVVPTGSGKTTLINDLELFANADTPTGRRILINDDYPSQSFREDPSQNPIALITQHTNFLSDLPVSTFLATHAGIRCADASRRADMVRRTIGFANQLTGEPVMPGSRMTELSGGQTRALLIADATIICDTPIVLLDEVENAGIHRTRALELLREHRKIFIFVTHDSRIALLSDFRIVMSNGRITDVIRTTPEEKKLAVLVSGIDDMMSGLREKIRNGQRVGRSDVRMPVLEFEPEAVLEEVVA